MSDRLNRYIKATDLITHKLSLVRALYIVSVASNGPIEEVLREFREAVGQVLEGIALHELNLTHIDKNKVKSEVAWLRERN
jgi:hypothetical protein